MLDATVFIRHKNVIKNNDISYLIVKLVNCNFLIHHID